MEVDFESILDGFILLGVPENIILRRGNIDFGTFVAFTLGHLFGIQKLKKSGQNNSKM